MKKKYMQSQKYNANIMAVSFNSKALKHVLWESRESFDKC